MMNSNEAHDVGRVSRLKQSLEGWREIVIRGYGVLGWEQDWYPAATTGVLTATFLFIWYWDPTLLTFFAILGLLVTIADYVGPKIADQVFAAANWDGAKEKKYGEVCEEILMAVDSVESVFGFCREARGRKPLVHFVATLASLVTLAWLGNRVNNFFLAYLLTLVIVMLPGLHRRGILQKHFANLSLKMAELIKGKDAMKKVE